MNDDSQTGQDGKPVLKVSQSGYDLLLNSLLNKGMAFTARERELFDLRGLLPPGEVTLATQRQRCYETFHAKPSPIEKYIYLRDLQDSNETLFYSFLCENIEELLPFVYTPVVGEGCQRYSHIYRRPRGIFLDWPNRAHMAQMLSNKRFDNVEIIVVSDGERILGLGDQGAGGMGIPIGKLALYSACAGIHPSRTLPVLLDTGTDNPSLQNDPLYIGWQHPRVRGEEYAAFIELFVSAIQKRFPHVLLHWEDFSRENARPLLDRYRNRLCSFNDDIQGTAAVAVSALLAACYQVKRRISEQKVIIFGAGSAGCGIAEFICTAMEKQGLSRAEALQHIFMVDKEGLLHADQALLPFQRPFARDLSGSMSLIDTIQYSGAGVLIGVSGQVGAFNRQVVRAMVSNTLDPVIFPLSNPDSHCEANPQDLLEWTEGRAIISTGTPFGSVPFQGLLRQVDQTNNCYIFPGLSLALVTLQATRVTDGLLMAAAEALADCSPLRKKGGIGLLPPLRDIREVCLTVATAVAAQIVSEGLNDAPVPDNLELHLRQMMWDPVYLPYEKSPK